MALPDISDYLVYTIEECKLFFKDRKTTVNREEILEFSVGCNFSGGYFFPEFAMAIKVDRDTFFDLMVEKDTATMNLKIGYHVHTPQTGEEADKGKTRIWFNEKFVIRMDANQYDVLLNHRDIVKDEYRAGEAKDEDVSPHKEYIIDLYLYKEKDINTAYTVTNRVYTSGDLNTIVTHQLTEAGASNVLMSPLENKSLTEVVAMPYTLIYNLIYLANQYGLHSHGTLIFFDIDLLYILNKKPGLTAWRGGENTEVIFVVREDTDDKSFMAGTRLNPDDAKGYVNLEPSKVTVSSYSTIDDLVRGGELISVDTSKATTSSVKNNYVKKAHPKYLHNKYGNQLSMKAEEQNMKDRNLVITVVIDDGNIHWFRPNKLFKYNFANPKLNKALGGTYKLQNTFMKFTNVGEHFRNSTTAIFSKDI